MAASGSRSIISPFLLLLGLLVPVIYFLDQNLHTQYVFEPAKLQEISQSAIAVHGNNTEALLRQITTNLKAEYGDAIHDWTKQDWFFNNAGGAMVSHSPSPPYSTRPTTPSSPLHQSPLTLTGLPSDPPCLHIRVPHLLRHPAPNRGPLRAPSRRRLFHHSAREPICSVPG
jgi:hypothetical protein